MNILPLHHQVRVISALVDGSSIRAAHRTTSVARETISSLLLKVGKGCAGLHDQLMRGLTPSLLEFDEIWCFIGTKEGNRGKEDPEYFGDAYTFIALDPVSKLVVSYLTDKRTSRATHEFVKDVRARVDGVPQISTDGFKPYLNAIKEAFWSRVHYGVSMKSYGPETDKREGEAKYSPNRITSHTKEPKQGNPDWDKINTSYVERQNLTLRMFNRRFTRLTNGWSRSQEHLRAAVALHFAHYNFCWVHSTIRVTPAMEAGVTGSEPEPTGERSTPSDSSTSPSTPLVNFDLPEKMGG
ncbi:MAG: IS1 family transposase [Myxococcales bacterium]|nr:IS1 family transposase [Myxococcales bacterium]